jgi:hypothetical protein
MLDSRGLHDKYEIKRVDGTDKPGGKHENCRLFPLDLDHDPAARVAAKAYAEACRETRPNLAHELDVLLALIEQELGDGGH